jgi:hypothetical protein
MKRNNVIYWVATGIVALVLGASGVLASFHAAPMRTSLPFVALMFSYASSPESQTA